MKTIAALSDIHGNILALQAVVADLTKRRVDAVVNLGDHVSGPLWPGETIQFLMKQAWTQISGNHDRQLVKNDPRKHGLSDAYAFKSLHAEEKKWLEQLPPTAALDKEVFLFHGTPSNDTEYMLETISHGRAVLASKDEISKRLGSSRSRIMLCGHTHIQRAVEAEEGVLIVNPGSVGLPAYKDELPDPHVIESGSPHARYAILRFDKLWSVELIAVQYDWEQAATRAAHNGREDWAFALKTGFVAQ